MLVVFPVFTTLVLVMVTHTNALSGNGTLCLSCNKVVQPRDCNRVTMCGEHEKCYVSRTITNSGLIWFSVGCEDAGRCFKRRKRRFSPVIKTPLNEGDDDVISCMSCCSDSALCNREGCGSKARPQSEGILCYKCDQQQHPNTCDEVALCGHDQSCFIEKTRFGSDILYSTGCKSKLSCSNSSDRMCCDSELCNDHLTEMHAVTVSPTNIVVETSTVSLSTPQTTTVNTPEISTKTGISCPYQWLSYESSLYCLMINEGQMTLSNARSLCNALGLHLPIIESAREQVYVKNVIQPHHFTIWLDGTDEKVEGQWIWNSTGQHLVYYNWAPDEPDHYFGPHRENCLEYGERYNMQWNDAPCHDDARRNHVLCEASLAKKAPGCINNWIPRDHYMYCIMDFKDSWHVAKKVCEDMQAHLPVADTMTSFNRIADVVGRDHTIWLDGTDEFNINHWTWSSSGLDFTYTNWMTGEPNDYKGKPEHCLQVVKRFQWRWNDAPCDQKGLVDKLVCERYQVAVENILG